MSILGTLLLKNSRVAETDTSEYAIFSPNVAQVTGHMKYILVESSTPNTVFYSGVKALPARMSVR